MKHVYLLDEKHYAFCAAGPYSKEEAIHIASSQSSRNAKAALQKVTAHFGKDITIVNDKGKAFCPAAHRHTPEKMPWPSLRAGECW
jgi:hypothetical protein